MIALYLAVLPVLLLAMYIYKLDKIEPEPSGLLVKCFLGGVISIIPAIILELILGMFINETTMPLLNNMVGIALVEEACKLLVLMLLIWNNKEFNYRFDAIVYAVFVSLGFACFENIMYVFEGGLGTAILRAFTAIPGHTIFAIFMGHYMGQAKFCSVLDNSAGEKRNKFLMLLIPVLIHGFYDYVASAGTYGALLVFFAFLIFIVILAFIKVRKDAREDIPLFHEEPSQSIPDQWNY